MCPTGCELEIKEEFGGILVSGNDCKRGSEYGKAEYLDPKRVVTALIRTKSGKVRPVKTAKPISKDKIFNLLDLIRTTTIDDSFEAGDVVIQNALNLADIILTN